MASLTAAGEGVDDALAFAGRCHFQPGQFRIEGGAFSELFDLVGGDMLGVVHGSQRIVLHRPFASEGRLTTVGKVAAVHDLKRLIDCANAPIFGIDADGKVNESMMSALKGGLDLDRTLLELTGCWIKGVTPNDIFELKKFLMTEFGPDVNLANVQPDDVMETEAMRCGLSVIGPKIEPEAAE